MFFPYIKNRFFPHLVSLDCGLPSAPPIPSYMPPNKIHALYVIHSVTFVKSISLCQQKRN